MSEEAIQDTGSQEAAPEAVVAEAAPIGFLESLPEELRNEPSLRTFTDPGALAKSYVNAQRMIGADKIAIPSKSATPDEWKELYTKLGAPAEVGGYEFEGDAPLADEYMNSFREHALNAGLNPNQANQMMAFVKNTVDGVNSGYEKGAEEAKYAAEQELREEFGQAFDQRLELAQMAARDLLGGTDIFDEIQLSDGRMLGDHPEIIKMFSNLASQIGEDNLAGETTELIMTPEEASRQITEMTLPNTPYWDKMHPEHGTFVNEVLRLREYTQWITERPTCKLVVKRSSYPKQQQGLVRDNQAQQS